MCGWISIKEDLKLEQSWVSPFASGALSWYYTEAEVEDRMYFFQK